VATVSGQQEPLRLFLIGNSFSQNASKFLPEISASGGHPLVIGRAELPGCELKKHWSRYLILVIFFGKCKSYFPFLNLKSAPQSEK